MAYHYVVEVDLEDDDDVRFFQTTVQFESRRPLTFGEIDAMAFSRASAFINSGGYEELTEWLNSNSGKYGYHFVLLGAFQF